MGAVAGDARAQYLDILAARLKAGRGRGDEDQPSARLQHVIGTHLNLAADRVEHDIAIGYGSGEILRVVIDDPVGAELADVIVIAGAGGRDDGRADMPGELDRYLIDKGSVTLDGVSLTIAALEQGVVSVLANTTDWRVISSHEFHELEDCFLQNPPKQIFRVIPH